jgi:hypothetical protein
MKERPILFTGAMVRALLAGTKTQTRRTMERQKKYDFTDYTLFGQEGHNDGEWKAIEHAPDWPDGKEDQCRCPYAQRRGDRLWVRENGWERPERTPKMMREGADTWAPFYYDADGIGELEAADFKAWGFKRRPSIHMPRWASRILLEVTEIRVQRLQEISAADCISEGIGFEVRFGGHCLPDGSHFHAADPRQSYFSLWEHINGPGSVEANPWVWAVSFRRLEMAHQ